MNANPTPLCPEVAELLKQLELKDGHVSFSRETFLVWRKRLRETAPGRRPQVKLELVASARRMLSVSVSGATEAIAQLLALAGEIARAAEARLALCRALTPIRLTAVELLFSLRGSWLLPRFRSTSSRAMKHCARFTPSFAEWFTDEVRHSLGAAGAGLAASSAPARTCSSPRPPARGKTLTAFLAVPRRAVPRRAGGRAARRDARALRLAAQGARQRRAEEPAAAARASSELARAQRARRRSRSASRCAPATPRRTERAADGEAAAAHPHHHARVALPLPDRRAARARRCARCRRSSWTRSTRWPATSAAPTSRSRWSGSRRSPARAPAAHRPVGHAEAARRARRASSPARPRRPCAAWCRWATCGRGS